MFARLFAVAGLAAAFAFPLAAPSLAQKKTETVAVAVVGNKGELRSEEARPSGFLGLFRTKASLLPETQALDGAMRSKAARRQFSVKDEFQPQSVPFSGYERGTIVVDTANKFLYLVENGRSARRYAHLAVIDGGRS